MKNNLIRRNKKIQKNKDAQNEVTLKSFKDDVDVTMINYYGEIYVGGRYKENSQKFKVLFDTGSTDIFLLDEKCNDKNCRPHKKYHKTKNYKVIKEHSSISYISGDIHSQVGTDDVIIGEILL